MVMLKIRDIMLTTPPTVEKSQPLSRALSLMEEQRAYCAIVLESGRPYGFISYKDVLKKVSSARFRSMHALSIRVSSFTNPFTNKLSEDMSIAEAAEHVLKSSSSCLPVCLNDKLLGILYPKLFLKAVLKPTDVVVAQVMRPIKEAALKMSDRVIHARKVLTEQEVFAVPVLTEDGKAYGVIDERDLVKAYINFLTHIPEKRQKAQISYYLLSDICKRVKHIVREEDYLDIAAKLMIEEDLSGLPVVAESEEVVGFLGLKEILNFISSSFKR
ncbi:MAG: hypothetical protein DRJ31_01270 [Candidatus Methanomethylicota archaeon]|uniref:CBS domain-containing protein n=1 Tax=Thermoproteota archaeon TaxID=2056631 RepID=A0A497ESZ0_9CREN|nr:MAG: hypothetical protein DRJ31_01270 [Candidatus Verstraetearchaeota archaeon]